MEQLSIKMTVIVLFVNRSFSSPSYSTTYPIFSSSLPPPFLLESLDHRLEILLNGVFIFAYILLSMEVMTSQCLGVRFDDSDGCARPMLLYLVWCSGTYAVAIDILNIEREWFNV